MKVLHIPVLAIHVVVMMSGLKDCMFGSKVIPFTHRSSEANKGMSRSVYRVSRPASQKTLVMAAPVALNERNGQLLGHVPGTADAVRA